MLGHRHTASQVRLVLILVFAVGLAALVGLTASAGATASAGFSASAWSAASARSAASGHLSWWYTEDSPAHALDAITAVAPGPNGSMYAAADMGDDWAAGADLVMYRFRPAFGKSGPMMWERTYNGPAHQADSPIAMVTDPAGNAIAAGQTATTATKIDWLIVKRSPSGAKEWIATWDGAGHDDDYLTGAACDGAGNVYACGMSVVGTSQYDAAVVKFRASDGKRLWKYVYAGPWTPQGRNWAHAIAVDASGNAYIAGQSDDSAGMPDILVMKLSPKGRVVWMRRVDGPAHLADYAEKIALRGRSVYVAAESSPVANSTSVMLLKYSTSGRRTWTRTWQDAPGITVSEIRALAVDGQGDPIVAGASLKATPFSKAFLVSWTPSGHQRWAKTYWKTATAENAEFNAIAVDGSGRIWAAGSIGTSGSTQDALLVRYSSSGTIAWTQTFDGDDHGDDWFNVVALWGKGSLFAGGVMSTTAGSMDVLGARYTR
jgi:hypothetical protein